MGPTCGSVAMGPACVQQSVVLRMSISPRKARTSPYSILTQASAAMVAQANTTNDVA